MRDIRNVDFNLLKALNALLEERNVTKAAQRLSVTQPAMSAMLVRLRESFKDPLFVRVQHGIQPTERALSLIQPVQNVLSEINAMLQPPEFDPTTTEMKLSIASTDYGLTAIATPFIAQLKQLAPSVKVALLSVQEGNIYTQLEQGKLDIALISSNRITHELHITSLYTEHYVCVMRADHPLAKEPLTLDNFCRLEYAMMSYEGGQFSGVADVALAKLGRKRKVSLSVINFLLLPDILRSTDLAALIPSRLSSGLEGLVCKPLPLEVEGFTIQMAWHERTHQDIAYQWMRKLLLDTVEKT